MILSDFVDYENASNNAKKMYLKARMSKQYIANSGLKYKKYYSQALFTYPGFAQKYLVKS